MLQREARAAADLVGAASRLQRDASDLLRQARLALVGLAEAASDPVGESTWLEAAPLGPRDARDVERYDDLLLAGMRRIREMAARSPGGSADRRARGPTSAGGSG